MSAQGGLLADKVVVVSGVGPGLGRSICLRAAAEGARVVLAARTESRLKEVAAEIDAAGGTSLVVPADITDDAGSQYVVLVHFGGRLVDVQELGVLLGVPQVGMVLDHVVAHADDHIGAVEPAGNIVVRL